jgi:hypothetical protein
MNDTDLTKKWKAGFNRIKQSEELGLHELNQLTTTLFKQTHRTAYRK